MSVLKSLKPLILASQITGFTLFEIDSNTWKAKIRFWNIFPATVSILMNFLIHIIFWNTFFTVAFDFQESQIIKLNVPRLIYINVLAFTVMKISTFLKRNKTVKMLKLLNEIDENFLSLKLKLNYESQQRKLKQSLTISILLAITLVTISFICHKIYRMNVDTWVSVMQLWAFFASVMVTHHIFVGLIGIRHRYELLNFYLKNNHHLDGYTIKHLAELHLMITR